MVTDFLANRRKLAYRLSFNALTFHKGRDDRNMDARVNAVEDPSTSDKNSVKFDPVTPEFCWRVCAQDQLHAALCDALRFNHIRQMAPTVDADAKSFVSVTMMTRLSGQPLQSIK